MKKFKIISAAALSMAMAAGIIPVIPAQTEALAVNNNNYVYLDFGDTEADAGTTYKKTGRMNGIYDKDFKLTQDGKNVDWMDFDGTLVISYDALLPKSGDTVSGLGSYNSWLRQTWYENGEKKASDYNHYFGSLGTDRAYSYDTKGLVVDGNPSAPGQDLGTGNAQVSWSGIHHMYTQSYTDFTKRRWATITFVAERDDTGSKFNKGADTVLWKAYLDGEQIYSAYGKSEVYQRPDKCLIGGTPAYEYRVKNAPSDVNITYGYPSVYFVGTSDSDNKLIDNYKISVYGGTELEKAVAVDAGDTSVKIPVINNAIDKSAPAGARAGQIKDYVSSVTESAMAVKAVKYSADDTFMKNGTDVSKQVRIKAQNPDVETIVAPAAVAGEAFEKTNGDTIFAEIPALAEGERLEITVTGVKDIKGNDLASNKTVIAAGQGLGGVECEDYFGDELELKDSKIDADVYEMTMYYPIGAAIKIFNVNGANREEVASSTVTNSINHTFKFSNCLKANANYEVWTINDEKIMTFTTGNDTVRFGKSYLDETDFLNVPYANTYAAAKGVKLVASSFEDDVQIDIYSSNETLAARTFGKLAVSRKLSTASTQEAFAVDLTGDMKTDSNVIRATVFDDTHKATVSGQLTDGKYAVIALDSENNIAYGRSIGAKDGAYSFTLNFDDFPTDTYELCIYTDKGWYSTTVAHSKNWSSAALEGASQSDIEDIFDDTTAMSTLEFAYPLFNELNDSQKDDVAAYLAKSLSGVNLNSKAATVGAFRTATIMVALENPTTAEKAKNYMSDASILREEVVSKWYYDTTNVVDTTRTEAWQNGVYTRLASYAQKSGFKNISDFENKFVEALVYEAISNHGATQILIDLMEDFEDDYVKAGEYATTDTITKLSEDEKTYTALDGFKTLKNDLKSNKEGSKKPSTGGGGGGGGTTPKKDEVPAVELPEATVKPSGDADEDLTQYKKSSFNDMENHNWAVDYVEALYDTEIIDGVGDNNFAPGENITREAFVKIIVNALNIPAPEEDVELPFEDVTDDSWFKEFVVKAYGYGVINGISDTLFGTGNNITRQDMAVIIYNAMGLEDDGEAADVSVFADGAAIADYAQKAVCTLAKMGIINGYDDNTFNPNGHTTRAEAAKVIYMVLDK